jgi:hypothetical protein
VCASRECRGRATADHAAPPDRRATPMPPCHVAPLAARPPPSPRRLERAPRHRHAPLFFPLSSSLVSARSRNPSPPPLFPWPHVRADRPDSRRRHAIIPPPSVNSDVPPSSTPFGPRLTSPVLSSSCRIHRRPLRPTELRRSLGTPPRWAIFSAPPRRPSPVRTPLPHLTRRNRCRSPAESPPGALHLGLR